MMSSLQCSAHLTAAVRLSATLSRPSTVAAVEHVGHVIHIRDQARLRAVNRRQSERGFEGRDLDVGGRRSAAAPITSACLRSATLSAASRAKMRLIAASAAASKRWLAFSFSCPPPCSAARRARLPAHSA